MLYIDQLGQSITLSHLPQRIISLVPSQTEYLFDIGLADRIVGITRFCIHPASEVTSKAKIGGTKQLDMEKIKQLQPDLIIGNKEENDEVSIRLLSSLFPVWMSDIYTMDDSFQMMRSLAEMTGKQVEGENIIRDIQQAFADYQPPKSFSCAYFIWRKPYLVAASNTFIDTMLQKFGCKNVFADADRYPEISMAQLSAAKPDVIFLSSEPYAFGEKHFDEFKQVSPNSKVVIADGEMFSWYGSRMKYAARYFELLKQIISV